MLQKICFALIVLAIGQFTNAQITGRGRCPHINLMGDIDAKKYEGNWYLNERYPSARINDLKCYSDTYDAIDDKKIAFRVAAVNMKTNRIIYANGFGTLTHSGQMLVSEPGNPNLQGKNYIGITDYSSYNVKILCEEHGDSHSLMIWLLSRSRNPSQATINTMHRILQANNISLQHLTKVDQTNCPHDELMRTS